MDISSLIGTVIGIITYFQARNISKELKKQKMKMGFKSQLSSLKSKLNFNIQIISSHETNYRTITDTYETLTIIYQFATNCKWEKKDVSLIKTCTQYVKSLSENYNNDSVDNHIDNRIVTNLLEIKSILLKEEKLL